MVKKHMVFGLNDLKVIRFRCYKCKNYAVKRLGDGKPMPSTCPFCEYSWTSRENTPTTSHLLLEQLERTLTSEQPTVDLIFEVDIGESDAV